MGADKLALLTKSKDGFFRLVEKCNDVSRVESPRLYLYRKVIEKHHMYKDMSKLLDDPEFFELIYITLIAWGMNQRKAKLVSFEKLKTSIMDYKSILMELYRYHLDSMHDEDFDIILAKIEKLFRNLRVMDSASRIVGVSKALHFLLPDLVMPIDRKYTLNYFYGYNAYSKEVSKEFSVFKDIFTKFRKIAKSNELSDKDVDNTDWNMSLPKLIDNAVIGYIRKTHSNRQ